MKVPHSYHRQFFTPVLLSSFFGHVVLFTAGGGLLSLSPEFGVRQAPSSMEVMILKREARDEKIQQKDQVFLAKEPSGDMPEVIQKRVVKKDKCSEQLDDRSWKFSLQVSGGYWQENFF